MQAKLIGMLLTQLLKLLPKSLFDEFVDSFLDKIETRVLGTASKVDDALVLPLLRQVRALIDVPDND